MPIVSRSRSELDLAAIDWDRVDTTPEADIARHAADPDTAPILTPDRLLQIANRIQPDDIDNVRAIRSRLGLSQHAFADRFGFSVATIRQYESHRRTPTGPIRTLLRVIAREPDAVIRALGPPTPPR